MDEERTILIKNARLVKRKEVEKGDVLLEEGRIAEVKGPNEIWKNKAQVVIEATGRFLSPGFIDLQVNGGLGHDFTEASPDQVKRISEFYLTHGTAGFLATLVSNPISSVRRAIEKIYEARAQNVLGIHLEGPFISREESGAHNPNHLLEPSLKKFGEFVRSHEEFVKLVTLAPELPGADKLIEEAKNLDIIPAIGHSRATYEEALKGVDDGAKMFTHLFNAMSGFHHRDPGCVGAALDSGSYISLILDGIHVHPASVRLLLQVVNIGKICLITDAISAAGMEDGKYILGDQEVIIEAGVARLPDGTLAGSTLTMDDAVRNFVELEGIGLPEAVKAASLNPAKILGLHNRKGSLEEGKDADVIIFDEELKVHYTIIGGQIVYSKEGA